MILTNHSHPVGTAVALDPKTGDITGTAQLDDDGPEGAAGDGKGRIFVNLEGRNEIQVIDGKTTKVTAAWPIPCNHPTGIAYDRATNRIFSGCSTSSTVTDAATGKVVASIPNGEGVDAFGWDAGQKLMYIPAGRDGTVAVVHQDSADKYTVVATVATMVGAKTIAVDPAKHVAYLFTPEYGPAPANGPANGPPAGGPPPGGAGSGRPVRGPVIGAWFFSVSH